MARVIVPDFASIVRARPQLDGMSTGGVIGMALGDSFAKIAVSASQNSQAKSAMLGFADAMQDTNPTAAATYRAFGNSVPAFDAGVLIGGGGGSGGGGGTGSGFGSMTGMTGKLMEDMLHSLKTERTKMAEIELDKIRTENDFMSMKRRATLEQVVNSQKALTDMSLYEGKSTLEKEIIKLQAAFQAERDGATKARLQIQIDQNKEALLRTDKQIENSKTGNQIRAAEAYTELLRVEKGITTGSGSGARVRTPTNLDVHQAILNDPIYANEYQGLLNAATTAKTAADAQSSSEDNRKNKLAAAAAASSAMVRLDTFRNEYRKRLGTGVPARTFSPANFLEPDLPDGGEGGVDASLFLESPEE